MIDKDESSTEPHGGLALVRYLIRVGRYDFREKVYDQIADGFCTEEDVESAILSGVLHKKERDEEGQAADGKKYTFIGPDTAGYDFYCCGKIMKGEDGKLFLVITAHRAR